MRMPRALTALTVETGARIRPDDRFRIGSNTKTFVAAVVL